MNLTTKLVKAGHRALGDLATHAQEGIGACAGVYVIEEMLEDEG